MEKANKYLIMIILSKKEWRKFKGKTNSHKCNQMKINRLFSDQKPL